MKTYLGVCLFSNGGVPSLAWDLILIVLINSQISQYCEDCADNIIGNDRENDLPILDDSIKSIAGESPQSCVSRIVVASFKSCSCTVGHLGKTFIMMMRLMVMMMMRMMMETRLNLGRVGGEGDKGEVLALLWEVRVADRESQNLKKILFFPL